MLNNVGCLKVYSDSFSSVSKVGIRPEIIAIKKCVLVQFLLLSFRFGLVPANKGVLVLIIHPQYIFPSPP